MKYSSTKTNAVTKVTLLIVLWSFFSPHQLLAITAKDIEKAEQKAGYKEKAARKHNAKVLELEAKLKKATDTVEARKKDLDIATAAQPRVVGTIERADASLRKATNKVIKLTDKLKTSKTDAGASQKKAEEARRMADKLASQRKYQLANREVQEATELLEFYQNKVEELEIEEREARAEVIAKSKLAARKGGGNIHRWKSGMSEKITESRADSMVEDLRIYREKVKETETKVEMLKKRMKETENKNEEYANE